MTDLQASLIVIGIAIIIAVILYNKWQERKERKSVEKAFSNSTDDVLMRGDASTHEAGNAEGARKEPVFDYAPVEGAGTVPGDAVPDTAESALTSEAEVPPAIEVFPKDLPADELIDCVIPLLPESPLRGEKVLPLIQGLRHIGSKPVQYIGERADGGWEPVRSGGAYLALAATVQLANRSGALNELEYSELISRLRQIADELGAELEVPDMREVMARARALHEFVAEYDAKLSINVQAKGSPWVVDTLMMALERQGFDLRPDGRLIMPDGDNGVLFSLSTNVTLASQTTSRLTLLLDVPCVAPLRDGFGAMVACAKSLATRLDGTVVDDAGQPLADPALDEIASQIAEFYDSMDNAGIPAGSVRAARLFN
jgi:FtsZ-interacting cell division protein ZipA